MNRLRTKTKDIGPYVLAAFGTAYAVLRFYLWRDRYFNPDELYYMHSTVCTAQGLLIFRDYFEFHGPLFPWLLAPLVKLSTDPIRVLFVVRAAITLPWLVCLAAVGAAADRLVGRRAAGLTLLLVCSFTTFALKSLEIRPDVPAAALFFTALTLSRLRRTPARLFTVGLLLGTAFFFTPKVIYPGIAMLGALLWEEAREKGWRKELLTRMAGPLLAGGVIPCLCLVLFFWRVGAIQAFYQDYFLFNQSFPRLFPPWVFLVPSFMQNKAVWVLALASLVWNRRSGVLPLMTIASLAGLFHLVLPYEQYYLLLAPLLCMLAAQLLVQAWDSLASRPGAAVLAGAVMAFILVSPCLAQVKTLLRSNRPQLDAIRCVNAATRPDERVLDMWTGASFARPHALMTWALPPDLRRRFDPSVLEAAILEALGDPRCRAFIWDANFEELSGQVKTFARKNYHAAGCGALYLRHPLKKT